MATGSATDRNPAGDPDVEDELRRKAAEAEAFMPGGIDPNSLAAQLQQAVGNARVRLGIGTGKTQQTAPADVGTNENLIPWDQRTTRQKQYGTSGWVMDLPNKPEPKDYGWAGHPIWLDKPPVGLQPEASPEEVMSREARAVANLQQKKVARNALIAATTPSASDMRQAAAARIADGTHPEWLAGQSPGPLTAPPLPGTPPRVPNPAPLSVPDLFAKLGQTTTRNVNSDGTPAPVPPAAMAPAANMPMNAGPIAGPVAAPAAAPGPGAPLSVGPRPGGFAPGLGGPPQMQGTVAPPQGAPALALTSFTPPRLFAGADGVMRDVGGVPYTPQRAVYLQQRQQQDQVQRAAAAQMLAANQVDRFQNTLEARREMQQRLGNLSEPYTLPRAMGLIGPGGIVQGAGAPGGSFSPLVAGALFGPGGYTAAMQAQAEGTHNATQERIADKQIAAAEREKTFQFGRQDRMADIYNPDGSLNETKARLTGLTGPEVAQKKAEADMAIGRYGTPEVKAKMGDLYNASPGFIRGVGSNPRERFRNYVKSMGYPPEAADAYFRDRWPAYKD
jgi:hypothetical protein